MQAKRQSHCLILLCSILILSLSLGLLILPRRSFSETENRGLAGFPTPTVSALLSGDWARGFSDFCSDQLPGRAAFLSLCTLTEQLLGKGEQNGVLFGKEGYLIPRGEVDDPSLLEANLEAISSLTHPLVALAVPRHVDVLIEQYPSGFSPSKAQAVSDAIGASALLFPTEAFQGKAEYYYKTDHHLTTEGAYAVYRLLGESLGYTPMGEDFFEVEVISNRFFGTSHAKAARLLQAPDSVTLYRYEGDSRFTVSVDNGETWAGFYRTDALKGRDHYEIFLGGNYASLCVTDSRIDGKKPRLLLIKDSFANALIPFLAIHFDLVVLDPRYRGASLPADLGEFDRILLLFGADTLATDASLSRFLLRPSS